MRRIFISFIIEDENAVKGLRLLAKNPGYSDLEFYDESVTAGCIDTDLPAGRRNYGQPDKPLIWIAHMHHAQWVTFSETCCQGADQQRQRSLHHGQDGRRSGAAE